MKRTPLIRRAPLRAIGKRSRLRDKEWKVNRALAMERAGGRCELESTLYTTPDLDVVCGSHRCRGTATEVHHRLPTSGGGKHDLDNLLALCGDCHRHIHKYPTVSYENGWLISRYGRTET
jgi:5-methylcytosine-specific restriction endonuclease McrA